MIRVGAAAGCDLLILIFCALQDAKDQKIAAFGSSYSSLSARNKNKSETTERSSSNQSIFKE
ncbi:hypothetical protein C1X64_01125 [Pseudomonas sp. GW456-E7]|nr:hypothetical protein C1X64_01125 [Pseudomonas sp. GW456-E7]